MTGLMRAPLAALFLVLGLSAAWAQGSVLQQGIPTFGHVPMYQSSFGQTVIQDSGGAGGGAQGLGLSELLQVSQCPVFPCASSGSGPFGTHVALYDTPQQNSQGIGGHYLAFDANALNGGPLIAVGTFGSGATPEPLTIDVNGSVCTLPGSCFGGVSFANPSNLIGLTPIDGVAPTAMRSDAAPALSQAINPIWTGDHYFASGYPWVDVKAYGAHGNASTDDTVQIQAAINAAQALGGAILYFPPGNYCVGGTGVGLVTDGSHSLVIAGAGQKATILQAGNITGQCGNSSGTGSNNVTTLNLSGPRSTIRDMQILGPALVGTNTLPTGNAVTLGSSCVGCIIEDSTIEGGSNALDNQTSDAVVVNSKFDYAYGSAVVLSTSGAFYMHRDKIDQTTTASNCGGYNLPYGFSNTARQNNHTYTSGNACNVYTATIGGNPVYLQLNDQSGCTSSGSVPALQPYGTAMFDGTCHWNLWAPQTYYGVQLDTSASPASVATVQYIDDGTDISGPYTASVVTLNTGSQSSGPGSIYLDHDTFSAYQADVWLLQGDAATLTDNQYGSTVTTFGAGVITETSWLGDTQIIGGNFSGGSYCVYHESGRGVIIMDNVCASMQLGGFYVAPGMTVFTIGHNTLGSSIGAFAGGTTGINIATGGAAQSHYSIVGNICDPTYGPTTCYSDNPSGTNKFLQTDGGIVGSSVGVSPGNGYVGEIVSATANAESIAVTISHATPAVVTMPANTFASRCSITAGSLNQCVLPIYFTGLSGVGISNNTAYFVDPASISGSTFSVATSVANALSGTDVATTGTDSGTGIASAYDTTSGTTQPIVVINLAGGNWTCAASAYENGVASTAPTVIAASIAAAATSLNAGVAENLLNLTFTTGAVANSLPINATPLSLASQTLEYLNAKVAWTGGSTNPTWQGQMWCRRS